MAVRLGRDLYGVLAAGMIPRERTAASRSARGAMSVAASDSSVGAGEAGTAGDGQPGGNCHHARRVRVRVRVRITRVGLRFGQGWG